MLQPVVVGQTRQQAGLAGTEIEQLQCGQPLQRIQKMSGQHTHPPPLTLIELFGTADGPGYADFVLAAAFIWFDKTGPDGGWEKIKSWDGGKWAKVLKNVQPFMQVL